MANKPLRYRPDAVPTPLGWAHEKTGEQITSHRNLEPAEGTEDYKPNSRNWMNQFSAEIPANTVLPVITGSTAIGGTLTASSGTWTGTPEPTFTYQWLRGGVNIVGATGSTYVVAVADQGANVAVKVTASNIAGDVDATSANTAIPAA